MNNLTDQFVDEMISLSEKKIPKAVIEQAKMCIIDYVACAVLGQWMLKQENQEYIKKLCNDDGNAILVGANKRISTHSAALLNGINTHFTELDDGHRYGMMHGGATVISALMAVASSGGIDGPQFIKGIVMGYEAAIRIASAIQPGHKLKGYHATATCGTIGAAVGIAVALGYSANQLKTSISAAGTDAAGLLEVMDDSSSLKAYNIGRAAVAGINAAIVGGIGFTGPNDILGGKRGFFNSATDNVKFDYLTKGFGDKYAIELIYRKPYAACRHCHAAIEAVIGLKTENNIRIKDIDKIQIQTYGLAVKGHDHKEIKGETSAKMSMPFGVAAGLKYGKADYQQFSEECIKDQELKKLINKVEVYESPELSALVPEKRAAIATIYVGEKSVTKRVDYPKGEPENPITVNELHDKYNSLMSAAQKDSLYAKNVLEAIWNIEDKFDELLEIL